MAQTVDVLIVEDQRLCVAALRRVFEETGNIRLLAHIESGLEVRSQLLAGRVDVLILDLSLPGKHGLEVLEEIRDEYPQMVIVILSMHEEWRFISRAIALGANAYLSKKADLDELKQVIFSSPDDPFYLGKSLREGRGKNDSALKDFASITKREKEVIRLIARGKSTAEISRALFISPETVKTHRKNIFRKLKLSKASELVRFALEHHVI
jgi:DNA-binding NarL/FixJ family response regulator